MVYEGLWNEIKGNYYSGHAENSRESKEKWRKIFNKSVSGLKNKYKYIYTS